MFAALKARLQALVAAPKTIAQRAAPRIQAKLREDATTKRGNVPQFYPGPNGGPLWNNVPIIVSAEGEAIRVEAPDWVMRKARELGQPAEWGAIVADEARKAGK